MNGKQPYSYVVLRYVHDVVTGEFVNVGVVLAAPKEGALLAKTRKTIGRIKNIFPDLDRIAFVDAMRAVDRGVRLIRAQVESDGMLADHKSAADYARAIVPKDDSSLQWSPVGAGITENVSETFEKLFDRFVTRYDTSSPRRKTDEDVWRPVRDMLVQRGLELPFETKVVAGSTDSIEFSRAWKNGRWHVYEPLSFDLADADGIKDKARKWRGHLDAVADGASEDVQLNFFIGTPDNRALLLAYRNAIEILKGAQFSPAVFEEGSINQFVDEIEDEVREHNQKS